MWFGRRCGLVGRNRSSEGRICAPRGGGNGVIQKWRLIRHLLRRVRRLRRPGTTQCTSRNRAERFRAGHHQGEFAGAASYSPPSRGVASAEEGAAFAKVLGLPDYAPPLTTLIATCPTASLSSRWESSAKQPIMPASATARNSIRTNISITANWEETACADSFQSRCSGS